MTPYERMIENQYWIEHNTSRVSGLEKQLKRGVRVDPTFIAVVDSFIKFIWPMSFEEDRIKLEALKTRLNKIRKLNPPLAEIPRYPFRSLFAPTSNVPKRFW